MNRIKIILLVLFLSGCSSLVGSAISGLTGGGPSLEAQVGKENTKQNIVVSAPRPVGRDSVQSKVSSENVRDVTVNESNISILFLALLILGWLLPSPKEILSSLKTLFRKKT